MRRWRDSSGACFGSGFLACAHRFDLERAALAGLVTRPERGDPAIDLIAKRGGLHEERGQKPRRAVGPLMHGIGLQLIEAREIDHLRRGKPWRRLRWMNG